MYKKNEIRNKGYDVAVLLARFYKSNSLRNVHLHKQSAHEFSKGFVIQLRLCQEKIKTRFFVSTVSAGNLALRHGQRELSGHEQDSIKRSKFLIIVVVIEHTGT
jgi:hypothetical protein